MKLIILFLLNIPTISILALFYGIPTVSVFATETFSDITRSAVICEDQSDCVAATEAIMRAENFFKRYGYVFNQSVSVQFKESALAALTENSTDEQEILGLYDPRTGWCQIPHERTLHAKKIFGCLNITKEFHISIITHEVAHRLYHLILEQRNKVVSRALHEFVAYVVQIETMKEPEKTRVLNLWRGEVLSGIENINTIVWALNPNRFAIMAYRFFLRNPAIMQSILDGKVKSDDYDQ